jgi:hypothetical protein
METIGLFSGATVRHALTNERTGSQFGFVVPVVMNARGGLIQNGCDNVSGNISQPEIASLKPVGEAFVVETQLM